MEASHLANFTILYVASYIFCLLCGLIISLLLLCYDVRVSSSGLETKLASGFQALLFLAGIAVAAAARIARDVDMVNWLDLVVISILHLLPTTIVSTSESNSKFINLSSKSLPAFFAL
jgi:hypothetical protein